MVAAVGLGMLFVAGCSSDDSPATQDSPAAQGNSATPETAAATTSTAAQPSGTPGVFKVGQPVDNGGLTVTIASVETVPAVAVSDGAGGYSDRTAPEGRQFVVLDADIANGTTSAIDLSCGTTIGTRLLDTQKRQHNVIDDLESVQGNRPCGDQVAPGTGGEIRWVFEVPADAVPRLFAFLNEAGPDPTAVTVVDLSVS